MINIAQGVIVTQALNYYDISFKPRIGFGAGRMTPGWMGIFQLCSLLGLFTWISCFIGQIPMGLSRTFESRCRGAELLGDSGGERRGRKARGEDQSSRLSCYI